MAGCSCHTVSDGSGDFAMMRSVHCAIHGNGAQIVPDHQAGIPSVQDAVIADIETRKAVGLERYGTLLQPHNGRDALQDAYEEAIDLAMYLKQAILERESLR